MILIVDDDDDIRSCLQELLQMEGFPTQGAKNGAEALQTLRGLPASPCIIFLDLMMPVMDGKAFLEKFLSEEQGRHQAVPVVFLTASSGYLEIPPGREVIRKPVELGKLLEIARLHCSPGCAGKPGTAGE